MSKRVQTSGKEGVDPQVAEGGPNGLEAAAFSLKPALVGAFWLPRCVLRAFLMSSAESANAFSFLVWWWANPLLSRGAKSALTLEDMWALPKVALVSDNVDLLEKFWMAEKAASKFVLVE